MRKAMKMFAAMFVAATMFALTGCSKDYEKEIIGSWEMVSETYTATYNGQSRTETETPREGESMTITFNEDKTYVIVDVYGEEGQSRTRTGTYSIKDDKLTMTDGDRASTVTVDIDGRDMTLSYVEDYDGPIVKIVVRFKKK